MIKKFLILAGCLTLLFLTSPAFAQQVNVSGLSEIEKAEIALSIAKAKANKESSNIISPESIKEYANLGSDFGVNIGKALAATARELGVEVNNFAKTDVGKLSIYLIIFHLFGSMIVHVVSGFIMLIIMIPIWFWSFRKLCSNQIQKVEHSTDNQNKPVKTVTYDRSPNGMDSRSGYVGAHWFLLIVIWLLSITVMFTW